MLTQFFPLRIILFALMPLIVGPLSAHDSRPFLPRSIGGQFVPSPEPGPFSGSTCLVSGSLGWNEPLLGTATGHTLSHFAFQTPLSGWTDQVPARVVVFPSSAFFSYANLITLPSSLQFGLLLVGGHPDYRIAFAGETAENRGSGQNQSEILIRKPQGGWARLFGEKLTVFLSETPVFTEIPFTIPQVGISRVDNAATPSITIRLSEGEPYSPWVLQWSDSLDWENSTVVDLQVVTLNVNGEAVLGQFRLSGKRNFFRVVLDPSLSPNAQ